MAPNLRALAYKYHLQNTYDFNDWFDLYTFFAITNDEREKEYTLDALANTRLTWLFDLWVSSNFIVLYIKQLAHIQYNTSFFLAC